MEADIKPLVAPSSPAYPWLGKQHNYWGRIRLWVSQAAEGTIDSRIIPVVLRHLQQEDHDVPLGTGLAKACPRSISHSPD